MTAYTFKPPPQRTPTSDSMLTTIATNTTVPTIDQEPEIAYAISRVLADYGNTVSVHSKAKSLTKFGRNDALGTSYGLVWMNTTQATETLPASNLIDSVSSSSGSDTQSIVIEGHTISGSDLTFSTQTLTLTGQTRVALTTPLARGTRLYNNGSTNFAGTVWAYENTAIVSGVPTDKTKAHLAAGGGSGKNQSEKAATAISAADYYFITGVYGSVLTKTAANVEFDLQIKLSGKVFRTRLDFATSNTGGAKYIPFKPCLIVPKNSDIRLRAKSSAANTEVEGGFVGYLAAVL